MKYLRVLIKMCVVAIIRSFAIVLFFASITSRFTYAEELYEGSECTMEDGTTGLCKKLPECPSRIADVRAGRRTTEGHGRCSFDNFVEIVCCPINISGKIGVRAADTACHEYENEVIPKSNENAIGNRMKSNVGLSFHILGGSRAATGEFPYMAALGYENDDGEVADAIVYNCGGALISSRFVLTAAHCVSNINNRVPIDVRLGVDDVRTPTGDTQVIPVNRIITEPKYKRSVNYNDIALIRLETPARMSSNVKPICLQTRSLASSNIGPNTSIIAIGFGATSFDAPSSNTLMKTANLSLVPKSVCSQSYGGFSKLPSGLDDNMICAVDTNTTSRSDACQGDSGGPLIMTSDAGLSIIGITSFGQSCGGPVPAVYTSVYSYLDWIETEVWPEQLKLR